MVFLNESLNQKKTKIKIKFIKYFLIIYQENLRLRNSSNVGHKEKFEFWYVRVCDIISKLIII